MICHARNMALQSGLSMRIAVATVRDNGNEGVSAMQDWQKMTAAELGRGIEAGQIDPVDLTDHFLSAIDAHEFSPRIYARLTHDRARAEALAARDRAAIGLRRLFLR